MSDLRDTVLVYVNRPNYQPVKPAVIAKKLGLVGDDLHELKKVVKKLVRLGELAYGPSHRVLPAKTEQPKADIMKDSSGGAKRAPKNQPVLKKGEGTRHPHPSPLPKGEGTGRLSKHFTGTFRRAAGGFGFVRPQGTLAVEGRDADVFIPADSAGDAANGDVVSVRLEQSRGRMGKQQGRVINVVQRATNRFVGLYFEQPDMGLVQVDGKVFANPIFVGDPGAKGVRSGDKVVIEMVRFPSHVRDGEAVIVEVIGQRGQPGVDTMSIIYEFNLPGEFAEDALADARKQAEKFDEQIGRGRSDLTDQTIVTIDPVDARDFDDAISLERLENGHWLLGVHIADVSHFVRPKTPLDREAHDRATSVYLPDRVIPMLPEIISNNLASLQPNKVRYALSAMIEMTEDGVRVAADVLKSAIKSRRRFTYEEVDQYLAEKGLVTRHPHPGPLLATASLRPKGEGEGNPPPSPLPKKGGETSLKLTKKVDQLLAQMFELAMILRRRRFERGALELSMPEMKIDLDTDGRVAGAHVVKNTESHQIIEEFMLAANEAVAERLFEAGLPFLRRVHGNPDPRKLKLLTEFARELGFEVESLESRFELQRLLEEVRGDVREYAVNYAVLRSMQRAVYSPEEEGHYALASRCYCHFTSPIRRYPDLTVHRLIDALAHKRKPEQKMDELMVLGDHCSEREQRATDAERELNKVKLLLYLSDKIGLELEGVITGVESFGLFVIGVELPAEGFVHISSLADDYYRYDRAGHVIEGFRSGNTFRLGDSVRVAVAAVDVDARQLDFRLLARAGAAKKPRGKIGPPSRGKKATPTGRREKKGPPPRKTKGRGRRRGR
jgi:ribonuclease R